MRLTICVWMLCSRGRSPTEQSPDRAKENERKFTRDKPSQADRRAFRAYSHRCPSRFHSGKLDNRLAKSSLSPMQSLEPISVLPSPKLGWISCPNRQICDPSEGAFPTGRRGAARLKM